MTPRFSLDTVDLLHTFSRDGTATCLSMLQPVDAHTRTAKGDIVVFRNLLRTAKQHLRWLGMDEEQAEHFLQPVAALESSGQLWSKRGAGLALFSTGKPEETLYFPLAMRVHEIALVGQRFYYKPLLGALHTATRFFVLVLSLNGARLLKCSNGSVTDLPLNSVSSGMDATLPAHDDLDAQRHARSFTRGGARGGYTSHSHGAGDIDRNAKAERYYKQVADAVFEVLKGQAAPLVLAGEAHGLALYRAHDRYAHTVRAALEGNRDVQSAGALRDEAAALLAVVQDGGAADALKRYRDVNNTARVTRAPKDIVRAAHDGRVQTLFVSEELDRWGRFDPATYHVQLHSLPRAGDISLLTLAAEFTLQHRGEVYLLPRSRIPRSAAAAAILRN